MKKISTIILFICLGIIIYLSLTKTTVQYVVTNDSVKFKQEYEDLNEKKEDNKFLYLRVNVKSYNPIVYSSYDEVIKLINNGTGIIYFGTSDCNWCRAITPILIDTAMENNVEKIYYLDISNDRDVKKMKNDKIKTTKEGNENYYKLLKVLDKYLPDYEQYNEKRIYLPLIVFVKDGSILGVEEVLESYYNRAKDNPLLGMKEEEKIEQADIFKKYIKELK